MMTPLALTRAPLPADEVPPPGSGESGVSFAGLLDASGAQLHTDADESAGGGDAPSPEAPMPPDPAPSEPGSVSTVPLALPVLPAAHIAVPLVATSSEPLPAYESGSASAPAHGTDLVAPAVAPTAVAPPESASLPADPATSPLASASLDVESVQPERLADIPTGPHRTANAEASLVSGRASGGRTATDTTQLNAQDTPHAVPTGVQVDVSGPPESAEAPLGARAPSSLSIEAPEATLRTSAPAPAAHPSRTEGAPVSPGSETTLSVPAQDGTAPPERLASAATGMEAEQATMFADASAPLAASSARSALAGTVSSLHTDLKEVVSPSEAVLHEGSTPVDPGVSSAQDLPSEEPSSRERSLDSPEASFAVPSAEEATTDPEISEGDALPPEAAQGEPTQTPDLAVSSTSVTPRADVAALPARLASGVWMPRLAQEARAARVGGNETIEVMLEGGGRLQVQTRRGENGLTVDLRFSDEDILALATLHSARIAEAVQSQLGEDVTLMLGGERSDKDPNDARAEQPPPSDVGSGSSPEAPTNDSSISPLARRREWIG